MNPADGETRRLSAPAVDRVQSFGYEALYIGSRTVRVTRPRNEHSPSYFGLEEFAARASVESRQQMAELVAAARRVNRHFKVEEMEEMSANAPNTPAKKSGKRAAGPIPKPGEQKRQRKTSAAKETAPAKSSKKAPAERASKKSAAKSKKGGGDRLSGADVPGATPEILAHLATFQEQTIERMNGYRVVEFYMNVQNATTEKPVARKDLTVYPARIAREMVRLGVVRQVKVEGVGLCYFPATAKK